MHSKDHRQGGGEGGGGYAPPTNWKDYMVNKKAKLLEQFLDDQQREQPYEQISNIFAGVKIHVNGLTKPTGPELRKLMSMHGGLYEQYPDSSVTHIIATNLPEAKFRLLTGKEKILLPEWITDSIAARKLLPEREYSLVDRMSKSKGNHAISIGAFLETPAPVPKLDNTSKTKQQIAESEKEAPSAKGPKSATKFYDEEFADGEEGDGHGWWMAQKQPIPDNEITAGDGVEEAVKRGAVATAKDKDFLQNYYKSSRLHHLSTWKAEFQRQLMAQLLEMYNQKNSGDHQSKGSLFPNINKKSNASKQRQKEKKKRNANVLAESQNDDDDEERFENEEEAREEADSNRKKPASASVIQNSGECGGGATIPPEDQPRRIVAHIDMDCFFAAVAIRSNPQLSGLPIVIAHSSEDSVSGSASVSSCNYEARSFGVKNGMSVGKAKSLCTNLRVVGYQFAEYEKTSKLVYEILVKNFERIQAVSCDEAYVELPHCTFSEAEDLIRKVRKQILEATQCNASAGIGPNMLLARMATKKAKPNGQFCIRPSGLVRFLAEQKVKDLPSVGPAIAYALKQKNITKLSDLLAVTKEDLQKEFGDKTGERLWYFSRGIDDRELQVFHQRKSVGVDLNWGVRLETLEEVKKVLGDLAVELSTRMQRAGVRGSHLTCKVKKRKPGAPTPSKWLGHGLVDNFSKSVALTNSICDSNAILEHAVILFRSLEIDAKEVRGLGLHMTKLSPLEITTATSTAHPSSKASALPTSAAPVILPHHHHPQQKRAQQVTLSQHVVVTANDRSTVLPHAAAASVAEDATKRSTTNRSSYAIRPEDFDAAVLAELPESFQQEIAEAYYGSNYKEKEKEKPKEEEKTETHSKKRKSKSKSKSSAREKGKEREKDELPITAMLDQAPSRETAASSSSRNRLPPSPPDSQKKNEREMFLSFETEKHSDVRAALKAFVSSISEPRDVHLELLMQFISFQLCDDRNLELSQRFLEWLRTDIENHCESSAFWMRAFNRVLSESQSLLLEKYSARFPIRSFVLLEEQQDQHNT